MPLDLSNLGSILPMLGALAGGGSSPGVLAGLGDAAHEENQRTYQIAADARKGFADQLERIGMDTENWNENARTAAMQARLAVLSNPKAGPKDFNKHWQSVLDASQRPTQEATEQNAAKSAALPALRSLGASGGAPMAPATTSVGDGANSGGSATLDSVVPGLSQAMSQAAGYVQRMPDNTATAIGPLTVGEKAQRAMAAAAPWLQMAGNSGGAGGHYTYLPSYVGGHLNIEPRVNPTVQQKTYFVNGAPVFGIFDPGTRRIHDGSGNDITEQIDSIASPAAGGTRYLKTADENGDPQWEAVPKSGPAGTTHAAPVPKGVVSVTNNGQVDKFNRDPYSGAVSPQPIASGTTPNRDIAEANLGVRQQNNARQQGNYNNNYSGTTLDVDGSITGAPGTPFVPNGTPVDKSGNPIGKAPYAETKPPAAVVTRAHVASDAATQAQTILDHLQSADMKGDFGPLRGRTLGWLVQHGAISDVDIKALQLQLASMESMNPAVHQMRNFAVAKDIATKLGDLGQPYENFVAGVKTLQSFYKQVAGSGVEAIVPTYSGAPLAPRTNATAPSTSPNTPSATYAPAAPTASGRKRLTLQELQALETGQQPVEKKNSPVTAPSAPAAPPTAPSAPALPKAATARPAQPATPPSAVPKKSSNAVPAASRTSSIRLSPAIDPRQAATATPSAPPAATLLSPSAFRAPAPKTPMPAPLPAKPLQRPISKPAPAPTTPTGPAARAQVIDFFKSKGWTPAQAQGITANIQRESDFNHQLPGDDGTAYGLAQWRGDRQAEFQKMFGHDIHKSTFAEQLEFIHHELTNGTEKAAGDALRVATTPREAGAAISKLYERPALRNIEARERGKLAELYARGTESR